MRPGGTFRDGMSQLPWQDEGVRHNRWSAAALLPWLLLPVLAACDSASGVDQAAVEPGTTGTVDLDDRPFRLHVPASYDPATAVPLVVLLHGYSSDAEESESYFQFTAESDRRGFLYAMPDGTTDLAGDRFWNATDACCNIYRAEVDDSGYLRRLIETVMSSYQVDPARIYLFGHSNGGFMAYRVACEHSELVAAVASLAGMPHQDRSLCQPEHPVSVLHIHGTADDVIPYQGADNWREFPSAEETVARWRDLNGCGEPADTSAAPLDLDSEVPGAETTVVAYRDGCRDGSQVALWTIQDGDHVPGLTPAFAPAVVDFLYAAAPAR